MEAEADTNPASGGALWIAGARGSVPVSGPEYARHGGYTTAFAIEGEPGHLVLFDAGTGLRRVEQHLDRARVRRFTVLFTHYHWDHVLGLPYFAPLFDARSVFAFHGPGDRDDDVREALERGFRPPWFPVRLASAAARRSFRRLVPGPLSFGDLTVHWMPHHHPGGVAAYRLERGERSVVIATDVERGDAEADARFREFAAGADVLIHDAQYLPDEYAERHVGWGHSTWEGAVDAARAAGARELVLTSHDPNRTDAAIDAIVERAAAAFGGPVRAACEGLRIPL